MKSLITFEVDHSVMFDMVAQVGDGGGNIGFRLVSALMAPDDLAMSEHVGMAVYGISVAKIATVAVPPAPSQPAEASETREARS